MALNLISKLGITGLKLQKYAPDILVGSSIAGIVAGGILACNATLKVGDILDDAKDSMEAIDAYHEDNESYTDENKKKDKTLVYIHTGIKVVKIYAPSVILGAASIAGILYGYKIINKRNIAIATAYATLEGKFSEYRDRAIEKYGKDIDKELMYGKYEKKDIEVEETQEDGSEKKRKIKNAKVIDETGYSQYARYFDSMCPNWEKNPAHNLMFLRGIQNYANQLLEAHGYLFLNDVYDMIGIPKTSDGAVVGWVKGNGDDYVSFGIDIEDGLYRESARNFLNGYEPVVLLDFNVDGLIWNKI